VGDDDQSIYRFRGADVGNMREFEREFRVANVIRLEQNYRSYGNILDAANAIIRNNTDRLGKNLWTERGAGEPIRVFEAFADQDEARWIVEEIQSLVRDGASRSDIALLYRSNAQSRVLEHRLFSAGVAYRVYGGQRFFERQEIKHALAYFRLIANPDDDTSFSRVVNFPTRGIGARSLEALQDAAAVYNSSLYATVPHLSGKPGTVLAQFVRMIEDMRRDTARLPLPELVDHVLDVSGLRNHYRSEKEGQDRLENLDELINAAANFSAESDVPGDSVSSGAAEDSSTHTQLANFLNHASLEAGDHQADAGADAVQLMTVHASKGLEFDVVFVSGLEEGLFPHENSILESDGLAEERRLMYVAITRARERLYLSFAQSRMLHGQTRYNLRSRFIEEIPQPLTKWLSLSGGRTAGAASASDAWRGASTAPRAPQTASRSQDLGGFRIGQLVAHAKFGQGVIVAAEGAGSDARVQINFGAAGIKWLLLGVAKLSAV
jgi:DNA helicase-2/ATP-dependent DNA helicase PcrA